MRLKHIRTSPPNSSHFAVLVRAIPWSDESYNDTVKKYFTKYHGSSYLGHEMVYRHSTVQKLMVWNFLQDICCDWLLSLYLDHLGCFWICWIYVLINKYAV